MIKNQAPANFPHLSSRQCMGRDDELRQLLNDYELAKAGEGKFILVTGKPGIGKSTFLAQAQGKLREQGALVLETKCQPGLPSYFPLLKVIQGLLEQLFRGEADNSIEASELLDILKGRKSSPQDAHQLADSRIRFFDQIAHLFREASSRHPVVVFFHDLDQADQGTLQLVQYLGRVLTARPELTGKRIFRGMIVSNAENLPSVSSSHGWSNSLNLVQIDLGGLDQKGVRAFLSSDLVLQKIMEVTGGIPHLLHQMVASAPLPTKSSTHLSGADQAADQVLQLIAVFGRPLGPETLRLLTHLPYQKLANALTSLTEQQILEKGLVDGELRLSFARVGDQQSLLTDLDPDETRALHLKIGEYLETLGDPEIEACAEHMLAAECSPRVIRLCLRAGQRLEASFCLERAADLYEKALVQADHPDMQILLSEKLSAIYEVIGQLGKALSHAEEQRRMKPEQPEVALRIARLHYLQDNYAAAQIELSRLEKKAPHLLLSNGIQARIWADLAEVQLLCGETSNAAASCAKGIKVCSTGNEAEDQADLVATRFDLDNTLAKIHLERDELSSALDLFRDSLKRARAMGLQKMEMRARGQLGLVHMRMGLYSDAKEHYSAAREIAEAIGERRFLALCLQHLGVLAERCSDFRVALDNYQKAVGICKKIGYHNLLAWIGLDLGMLYLKLGDIDRAKAMADLSERLANDELVMASRINLELLRGGIAQQECKYSQAAQHYGQGLTLSSQSGQKGRQARCVLSLAEQALERGNHNECLRILRGELDLPRQDHLRPSALLIQVQAEIELEEYQEAQTHLAEALELSELLPDPESQWHALLLMALLTQRQGRPYESERLLTRAVLIEQEIRDNVPAEFRASLANQPKRSLLRAMAHEKVITADPSVSCVRPLLDFSPQSKKNQQRRRFGAIIGAHRSMVQVYGQIEKVAPSQATLLIQGESGTGKELIAEAIHTRSNRNQKPLIKVNCGALVESLLLSELFGHERGAFTGATQRRKGRFELADGGTIFLDEIGDISLKTQVALLRVLQEHEFERVGGTTPIQVNVRVLCATHRNLEQMVERGEFREDLYYRINTLRLEVPPLRNRISDLPLLTDHFLEQIALERGAQVKSLTQEASRLLCAYNWPGNIRELANVLHSATLFTNGEILDTPDFADYPDLIAAARTIAVAEEEIQAVKPEPTVADAYLQVRTNGLSLKEYKKQIEIECITAALKDADHNITRAAELLGMKRPRLSQLIKEHGISL